MSADDVSARSGGDRFGPYTLVRRLGAGAMGEVWEAILSGPAGFQKQVAVKLLRSGPVEERARDALIREARLGALLQHPNVVGTLGLGVYEGTWCVALELVRGLGIDALWRSASGRLPPGVVLEIGLQAAAGLHHIHALTVNGACANLVHRDIKPANLLVDRTGLVKVADLGISLPAAESGSVSGTPGYMAPEQAAGRAEARSDLYSLGVTLYQLATGRRLLGTGAEALANSSRIESLLRDPQLLAPAEAAVVGLGVVLRQCLRADPRDRFASARELMDALAALRVRQPQGPTLLTLLRDAAPDLGVERAVASSESSTQVLPKGNLRTPRDRFVGRGEELKLVAGRLREGARLVVLLGPGGMGKTRLALEVAHALQHEFAGGAWALDLTEARDEDAICRAFGVGLGVELQPRDAVEQIGRILGSKGRSLVLLDNLEQCVDALPPTLGRWLDAAPEAQFLCTSQRTTGLAGEKTALLGPLAPEEAAALLIERSPRPFSADERSEIVALCVALDGMPLAIELCAARLRLMDVATLRGRLGLALLSGGGRDRPARHRSVEASLQWSWGLLSERGRLAMGQLSVFEAGFQLEAAEAVLGDGPGWALDVVQELVEASLLRVDAATGRFSLMAVVREFAQRAAEPAARSRAEEDHGRHFAQYGSRQALNALTGAGGVRRYQALAVEIGNLVAACRRAVQRQDGPVAVAALCAADPVLGREGPTALHIDLARAVAGLPNLVPADRTAALLIAAGAWLHGSQFELATDAATVGLAIARDSQDRLAEGHALQVLGLLARHKGQRDAAFAFLSEALRVCEEAGDRHGASRTLGHLGLIDKEVGRSDSALSRYEQAIAVHRELGDRTFEGRILGNLGNLRAQLGLIDAAEEAYEAAVVAHREVGDQRAEGLALSNIGILHLTCGRYAEAERYYHAALALNRRVGDRRAEGAALGNLAGVSFNLGRIDLALRQYTEALAIHREVNNLRFEVLVLASLASVHRSTGAMDAARSHMALARKLSDKDGQPHLRSGVLADAADLEMGSGDLVEATRCLDEAEVLARATGAPALLVQVLCARARLWLARAEGAQAILCLSEADSLAAQLGVGLASPLGKDLAATRAAVAQS